MEIIPPRKIKIIDVQGKGRGVVATEDIKSGEIIEICPIIFISEKEGDFFEKNKTSLNFYWLLQPETNKSCIMLGYGSLYNHSINPNAEVDYETKESKNYLFFRALKDIKSGEEIVFDYQSDSGEEFLKLS
jgi:SET domain-containing protein